MTTSRLITKRLRSFKRWRRNNTFKLSVFVVLSLAAVFAYAGYMANERLAVNPESYKPLLNLIAGAESNGNYNAYFGNPRNNDIRFTEMTVAEVRQWQEDYIAQGSPSSAVGRYQIISGTLDGLINELGIEPTQKFNESTQDTMAIALLERRGSVEYVNDELSKEQFAANLAKEWAALPKVVGDNPDQSYYAGDGLNKSRVAPDTVLAAIRPIEPAK